MLWLAVAHPLWFGLALGVLVVASVVLTLVLFKFLRLLVRKLRGRLGAKPVAV